LIDMVARDEAAYRTSGNVLLDRLLGARVHFVDADESASTVKEILDRQTSEGRKPYVVPIGGSNVTGALGYIAGFGEIDAQAKLLNLKVDAIVHASSSAGTQAGLIIGASLAKSTTRIVGVNVYKKRGVEIATDVRNLALETAERMRQVGDDVSERVEVIDGYQGDAYGQPTDEMRHALNLAARHEGLIFDPVYSGKALAALIGEIARGTFTRDQTLVFIHTGGTAALGAYAEALKATQAPEN
jgi:1-aminocyclopropane-1-carboxylate deaminase/D-cysteine desulfhydrase-like pyridoxal-dependent ACC family enzyme